MHIRILITLLSAVLITSCGTTKLSSIDISKFDAGKKSLVRTDNMPIAAQVLLWKKPIAKIEEVDGEKVNIGLFRLNNQVAVDVGLHQIEFSCRDPAGAHKGFRSEIIQLDLKPNHEYVVDCWLDTGFNIEENSLN